MDKRKQHIFNILVSEYLTEGKPVASEYLVKKYNLSLSPATVRNYFKEFGDEGLIEKSHFSSGRIPTDYGIKKFAQNCDQKNSLESYEINRLRRVFAREYRVDDLDDTVSELLKTLTGLINVAGIGFLPHQKRLFKYGLPKLIFAFDLIEKKSLIDILNMFENLDELMSKNYDNLSFNSTQVFIGGDNPFFQNDDLSIIVNRIKGCDDKCEAVISVFGSKRMMYPRALSILNKSVELLNNWQIKN